MDNKPIHPNKNYLIEQFESVASYMEAHLTENIGLYDISFACNMSISKLSSLFRSVCGCSPMAYFNAKKIDEAKRLIDGGETNMSRISARLGFGSSQYFSKVFKKYAGITPTEYQAQQKR